VSKGKKYPGQVTFREDEVRFLKESRLARIATVSSSGQPHVVPVGYDFDGKFFYFGGFNITKSLKFRNIQKNNKVALVVDDLLSVNPWTPRFVMVRGTAEIITEKGPGPIDKRTTIKVTPLVKRSTFAR
jgi:pyridoxamine 5'-phosphate oxidase family protein